MQQAKWMAHLLTNTKWHGTNLLLVPRKSHQTRFKVGFHCSPAWQRSVMKRENMTNGLSVDAQKGKPWAILSFLVPSSFQLADCYACQGHSAFRVLVYEK
jgi:hypothetical protein